jgi:hypothetical protein
MYGVMDLQAVKAYAVLLDEVRICMYVYVCMYVCMYVWRDEPPSCEGICRLSGEMRICLYTYLYEYAYMHV